jgi:small subunit ribosomal protein S2
LVRELLDAGIHFGHRTSRWNPKMAPFIYGKRNGIHIVDIRETLRGLLRARKFLTGVVARGGDVLFVGTKRQARQIVEKQAARCNMHYVSERWLGGTLTNFRTIRSRLQRLDELENLVSGPTWETGFSKKMKSTLTRELEKIRRNLAGIRRMNRLPGALIVIDLRKEMNCVREAQALGIPTVGLLDTDSDPDLANIPIPGNDDAMRSIEIIVRELADAVEEGLRARPADLELPPAREIETLGAPPRGRKRRGERGDRGPGRGAGRDHGGGARGARGQRVTPATTEAREPVAASTPGGSEAVSPSDAAIV